MLIIFYGNIVLHHVDTHALVLHLFSKDKCPGSKGTGCHDRRPAGRALVPIVGGTGSPGQGLKFISKRVLSVSQPNLSLVTVAWADAGHRDNGTKFFMVTFNVNIRLCSTFVTSAPLGSQTPEEATGE